MPKLIEGCVAGPEQLFTRPRSNGFTIGKQCPLYYAAGQSGLCIVGPRLLSLTPIARWLYKVVCYWGERLKTGAEEQTLVERKTV